MKNSLSSSKQFLEVINGRTGDTLASYYVIASGTMEAL